MCFHHLFRHGVTQHGRVVLVLGLRFYRQRFLLELISPESDDSHPKAVSVQNRSRAGRGSPGRAAPGRGRDFHTWSWVGEGLSRAPVVLQWTFSLPSSSSPSLLGSGVSPWRCRLPGGVWNVRTFVGDRSAACSAGATERLCVPLPSDRRARAVKLHRRVAPLAQV